MSRKQIPIFEILVGKGCGTVSPSHRFVYREISFKRNGRLQSLYKLSRFEARGIVFPGKA